ncbi:Plancitoxin-1, partial [Trichinella sp. T9]
MTHLAFRRDSTAHLLRARPLQILRPKHNDICTLRSLRGHFLQSITQGRCKVCKKLQKSLCSVWQTAHLIGLPIYHQQLNIMLVLCSGCCQYVYYSTVMNCRNKHRFIAWGAEAGKAIWVIHTMDKFVNLELVDSKTLFNYAPLQDKAGMLMCLTFSYNLNEWAEALLYEDAVIYFWQMPKTPGLTQTAFRTPAIQALLNKETPRSHFSKYTKTMTTASQTAPVKIHTISKFGNSFSLDMYISLILKILHKPIRVWTGKGANIQPSFCKRPLLIENVVGPFNIGDKEINFRKDTARWSVVDDTLNLFCLSTVGREKNKVEIPSGVVCIEQSTVHNLFKTFAADNITQICKQ